jgi:hypothetical protein
MRQQSRLGSSTPLSERQLLVVMGLVVVVC